MHRRVPKTTHQKRFERPSDVRRCEFIASEFRPGDILHRESVVPPNRASHLLDNGWGTLGLAITCRRD